MIMKRQLTKVTIIFSVILISVTVYFSYCLKKELGDRTIENGVVILNEIDRLTEDEKGNNIAKPQINELKNIINEEKSHEKSKRIAKIVITYIVIVFGYTFFVLLYVYYKILKPFNKLEDYAEQIAKGNLDISLKYEKINFFGEFTWAFDHMREEMKLAKRREETAIEQNKTIIATLSHDIKTPIASISAYAEALEAGIDSNYESRQRYISVIMKKCKEVTNLTNDLVMHSLSELDKLEIKCKKCDIKQVLLDTLKDLEYSQLTFDENIPEAEFCFDEKRIAQVIENLINNAKKYAKDCNIHVSARMVETRYEIHVRDYGKGLMPEDIPFIFDKFYRGKNTGDQPGSGLGLYIVKYIMTEMNGGVELNNYSNGLEVIVWMKMD